MSTQSAAEQVQETIGFARLRALALRGYRPFFDQKDETPGFISVRLAHPRMKGSGAPPALTLWNDGTIATPGVLWPQQYVPTEDGPPGWQKYIHAADDKTFAKFAASVAMPTWLDLYAFPALRNMTDVTAKLAIGSLLCGSIAGAFKLATCLI